MKHNTKTIKDFRPLHEFNIRILILNNITLNYLLYYVNEMQDLKLGISYKQNDHIKHISTYKL